MWTKTEAKCKDCECYKNKKIENCKCRCHTIVDIIYEERGFYDE